MENKKVCIVTVDGKKYTGILDKIDFTPLGNPRWFNISTPTVNFKINADQIVVIMHWVNDPNWVDKKNANTN